MADLNRYGIGFTIEGTLLASSIARSHALQHWERMQSVLMGRIRSQVEKDSPIGYFSLRIHSDQVAYKVE